MALFSQYLTANEEALIHEQFKGDKWQRNNQVLWSGILRDEAQCWADEHHLQTLTTAMGPLMDPSHPLCLKHKKSSGAWSKYIKGASAVFAWYISQGEKVTVLSPPPPERFHPSGKTSFQLIEEPIVMGKIGTIAVSRIEMVHPTVKGAENFYYQIWPVDETTTWTARFGQLNVEKRHWRAVKTVISFRLADKQFTNDTHRYIAERSSCSSCQEVKKKVEKKEKKKRKNKKKKEAEREVQEQKGKKKGKKEKKMARE